MVENATFAFFRLYFTHMTVQISLNIISGLAHYSIELSRNAGTEMHVSFSRSCQRDVNVIYPGTCSDLPSGDSFVEESAPRVRLGVNLKDLGHLATRV